METKKDNNQPKADSPLNPGGFDLNGLMANPAVMDFLKMLLPGAGAMAGNYFLWIKPMQDKMEAMQDRIEDLEEELDNLKTKSRDEEDDEDLKGTGKNYFRLKQKPKGSGTSSKYPRLKM